VGTDAKAAEPDTTLGPLTVLLVEDEPSVARLTATWLKKMGCVVIASTNGREADTLASEISAPIDLLLADVMLPGMRGPVLAGAIRRRHPETAVLFTSGYSPELVSELFAEHVDTAMLLRKPYTAAQSAPRSDSPWRARRRRLRPRKRRLSRCSSRDRRILSSGGRPLAPCSEGGEDRGRGQGRARLGIPP
jgi:CheY-like chemotaxis protein